MIPYIIIPPLVASTFHFDYICKIVWKRKHLQAHKIYTKEYILNVNEYFIIYVNFVLKRFTHYSYRINYIVNTSFKL